MVQKTDDNEYDGAVDLHPPELPVSTPDGVEMRPAKRFRGFWCRDDMMDSYDINIDHRGYKSLPIRDRVVMDIGANMGGFTGLAATRWGAKTVISFEPEAATFEGLRVNTGKLSNVVLMHGCADLEDGETSIWLSSTGRCTGNTSQTYRRGRFEQKTPKFNVHRLMREHSVQSVKIDAEGAEYKIAHPHQLPDTVTDICGEFHLNDRTLRAECALIVEEYRAAGWIEVVKPVLDTGAWYTMVHWRRRSTEDD